MMNDTEFKIHGFKFLQPVTGYLNLQLEQVNFLACQLFALAAAFWFRLYLSPAHANPLIRHAVATLLGVAFLIFCYGWYSAHILIMVIANYLITIKADINNVHRYSMVTAMGYLTLCHLHRVIIFNYGVPSTDFSGPLMIVAQKITTLAFQLHDGMCKKSERLTLEQKLLAINARPSLIEYLSYNLNFLSVLVGPCSNYRDYIDFIEGKHINRRLRQHARSSNGQNGCNKSLDISPNNAVFQKVLVCCGCLLCYLFVTLSLPIRYNTNEDFVSKASFLTRLRYAFFSVQAARPKFYFAWTLADAVNNAAGYGFMGIDKNGKPSWDLISNINIIGIETATSFKTFIDNWNIQTGIWLKLVCYDRASKHQLALTFILSALWHGVYPGYYFTFLTAIPITIAARAIRRNFRDYFLGSKALKLGYDIVTWLATQLAIGYTVMPFLLLSLKDTLTYYSSMYFYVHIFSILAALTLSWKHKPREAPAPSSSIPSSTQYQYPHSNNNDKKSY